MVKKALRLIISSPYILMFFVRSKLLSVIYYLFFSRSFSREQQAVLYGRLKYLKESNASSGNQYLLRRNTHRIEKGLLMKPRRNIFALDYIAETVASYESMVLTKTSNGSGIDELQWTHDVLEEYFSLAAPHPIIDKAKHQFRSINTLEIGNARYVPYKRNLNKPSPVSYDAFCRLAQRRRSVRWYLPHPVPRNLIDQALSIATLSPSACNRQPFKFHIFDETEWVQKIAKLPGGTGGFSQNIPVMAVVVGRLRAYFSERDRHLIYIDGALAAMSFMYALETLGLSSCPINWPDIEALENQISQLLQLEADERVIMLISLGYPDPEGMVAYSQKKPVDEIRRYNLEQ